MNLMSKEEIKEHQLEILDFIDDICKKNNIPYFLSYGSMLGAVRHKGMIPWDDDIDLGIPRKYYDKLIELLSDNEEVVLEKNIINLNVLQYKKKENIQFKKCLHFKNNNHSHLYTSPSTRANQKNHITLNS